MMSRHSPWLLTITVGFLVGACGLGSDTAMINKVYADPTDTILDLGVASCNATITYEVAETSTTVTITVTTENSTSGDCLDQLFVELDDPVGQRQIIDGSSGAVIPLSAPD